MIDGAAVQLNSDFVTTCVQCPYCFHCHWSEMRVSVGTQGTETNLYEGRPGPEVHWSTLLHRVVTSLSLDQIINFIYDGKHNPTLDITGHWSPDQPATITYHLFPDSNNNNFPCCPKISLWSHVLCQLAARELLLASCHYVAHNIIISLAKLDTLDRWPKKGIYNNSINPNF